MADATYQPKVYRKQGGDKIVVASGGQIAADEGGYFLRNTPTPATVTTAATLTTAGMLGGLITGSDTDGSTVAITLPTGTVMSTAITVDNDQSFDFTFINLSPDEIADTYTLTAATGFTIVGRPIIDSIHADAEFPNAGTFRCRQTAANTWVAYRIN